MTNIELLKQDDENRKRLCNRPYNRNYMVSAGAGAGKTYTIVERVFGMLTDPDAGILPQDIVMITMTIRAATVMRERLSDKLRKEANKAEDPERKKKLVDLLDALPEMQISTIHSFCRRILNDYPLESGVGFAPQYESDDADLKGTLEVRFADAWDGGECPECQYFGISKKAAFSLFENLYNNPTVKPQYLDLDSDENKGFVDETVEKCRGLVDRIRSIVGNVDPDLFTYRIREALTAGDNATVLQTIGAARKIAKSGKKVAGWTGSKSTKTPEGACKDLREFLELEEDTEEAVSAMSRVLAAAGKTTGETRRGLVYQEIWQLPDGYRQIAELAKELPDEEELKELGDRIDLMLHGVATKEISALINVYLDERKADHIIALPDQILRTAELVKNHAEVRAKLHNRYKVFFVDEYQDTNPLQTDIIFGIAADEYNDDWRESTPGEGRLFIVGDAKQGIYRFTGADIALWHEAEKAIGRDKEKGEVVPLSKNYRSSTEICDAVTKAFDSGNHLAMTDSEYQIGYQEMVSVNGHGPKAVFHHIIPCVEKDENAYLQSAIRVASYIRNRVDRDGIPYGDFLILSFNKEFHTEYADAFRYYHIPVKFDGKLDIKNYNPIVLLNLRVQAVCKPFDERLSFRVLCECGDVLPQEWDLFKMTVKQLPVESNLTGYRNIRTLMGHVKELKQWLPETPMNNKIIQALEMLDEDRRKSQHREPCAFLDELVEKSEGLFKEGYDAETFQTQYAALKHVIDSLRKGKPRHFADMAEMLNTFVEKSLDRMPSVRTDNRFVRLMNLHKAKGLEGKILIYLPGTLAAIDADRYIQRSGNDAKGWFVIKGESNRDSSGKYIPPTAYNPPEWAEKKDIECSYKAAERVRLKYVALTRAKEEAHFFDFETDENSRAKREPCWLGFEDVGERLYDPDPEEYAGDDDGDESEDAVRAEMEGIKAGTQYVTEKYAVRKSPSAIDKETEKNELLRIREENEEDNDDIPEEENSEELTEQSGGKDWGSAVHRAAELIVSEGLFTKESLHASIMQAVTEQFKSELLSAQDRDNLQLPKELKSLDEIHAWLSDRIFNRLKFMMDDQSEFRQDLQGAEVYAEMPFTVSINKTDGGVHDTLASCLNVKGDKRLELSGKIDLALRYPDGSWIVADYKTDRMLPEDNGDKKQFHERLKLKYGNQLDIYRIVLEYLTGERVKETKILSV